MLKRVSVRMFHTSTWSNHVKCQFSMLKYSPISPIPSFPDSFSLDCVKLNQVHSRPFRCRPLGDPGQQLFHCLGGLHIRQTGQQLGGGLEKWPSWGKASGQKTVWTLMYSYYFDGRIVNPSVFLLFWWVNCEQGCVFSRFWWVNHGELLWCAVFYWNGLISMFFLKWTDLVGWIGSWLPIIVEMELFLFSSW